MPNPDQSDLEVRYLAPQVLKPDPKNPRLHKPPQIGAIARSIQTFGFNVTVLVDSENHIIAGHGRVAAAIKLGLASVPVVSISHLSRDQRQAYMIADNRLTDTSRWDEQLLGEVLRDLSVAELDFELDAIGFSVGEIDMKIHALEGETDRDLDDAPAVLVEGPAATRAGDLWLLGKHRLLCGDALEPASWNVLMNGAKAQMVFADVPYNLKIGGFVSGLGKVQHREFQQASGEMDRDEFTAFLTDAFRQMAANSVPGSLHYARIDFRHLGEMTTAGEAAFSELKNVCV